RPEVSIWREAKTWRKDSGKSSPTTLTRRGRVKKLAVQEKNVAEPPRASSALPVGASIESNAMEPTTRSADIPDSFVGEFGPLAAGHLPSRKRLRGRFLGAQRRPALDQRQRHALLHHLVFLVEDLALPGDDAAAAARPRLL